MKKFDLMPVIGIFLGITVLLLAIFNNAGAGGIVFFIQIASILIVGGGTISAVIISFSFQEVKSIPKVLRESFQLQKQDLNDLIDTFIDLSGKARREGLLSLEASADEVEDPFIRKGVLLAVDGIEPEVIKDIMMAEVVAMEERHRKDELCLRRQGNLLQHGE